MKEVFVGISGDAQLWEEGQRRLRIGYSRAARLIDLLEERGVIGQPESGGRSREVFEGGNGSERRGANGDNEGRTVADEVADIIAEEKARQEFLKKQGIANTPPTPDES